MITVILAMATLFPAFASERNCHDEVTALYRDRSECKLMFFVNDNLADHNWIVRVRCGGAQPTVSVLFTHELYNSLNDDNGKKIITQHSNLYENEVDAVVESDKSWGPVCVDKNVVAIALTE